MFSTLSRFVKLGIQRIRQYRYHYQAIKAGRIHLEFETLKPTQSVLYGKTLKGYAFEWVDYDSETESILGYIYLYGYPYPAHWDIYGKFKGYIRYQPRKFGLSAFHHLVGCNVKTISGILPDKARYM